MANHPSMDKLFLRRAPATTIFFSIWIFFHKISWFTGQQAKGKGISLTPLYDFHSLHRQLDINQAITAESSPLLIANSGCQYKTYLTNISI